MTLSDDLASSGSVYFPALSVLIRTDEIRRRPGLNVRLEFPLGAVRLLCVADRLVYVRARTLCKSSSQTISAGTVSYCVKSLWGEGF